MSTSKPNWRGSMRRLPAAGAFSSAAAPCTERLPRRLSGARISGARLSGALTDFRVWCSGSDVAAFDLFRQRLDQLRHLVEVGIDRERLAEGVQRPLVVAEVLHDHAEPGQRAEMTGLAYQHLLDVLERTGVIVLQVIDRRPPVPGLDIVRPQLDH